MARRRLNEIRMGRCHSAPSSPPGTFSWPAAALILFHCSASNEMSNGGWCITWMGAAVLYGCSVQQCVTLSTTEAEIIAFAREHLAGFQTPKTVIFGELPKTSTGKIQKFELRQRAKDMPTLP